MTVFSVDAWETQGIVSMEGSIATDDRFFQPTGTSTETDRLRIGSTVFVTREGAVREANKKRERRIRTYTARAVKLANPIV